MRFAHREYDSQTIASRRMQPAREDALTPTDKDIAVENRSAASEAEPGAIHTVPALLRSLATEPRSSYRAQAITQLQRAYGNRCVAQLLHNHPGETRELG